MGWRFRRSVKLFPGVRLNFSRGGISTTIGVPGASINFGKTGTYLNSGIPGTGLSCRTRLFPETPERSVDRPGVRPAPLPVAEPPALPPGDPAPGEIRSAAVSELTSPGLGELKRLINEAALQRAKLERDVREAEVLYRNALRALRLVRLFIVRLFTRKMIPDLVKVAEERRMKLAEAEADLAACEIDIEFAFDDAALNSFAALTRAFDGLRSCSAVWDVTSSIATNRVVQRTIAQSTIQRTPVRFDIAGSPIINTKYKALVFGNANGEDVYIYPGFVMMRSPGQDFALIDVRDLDIRLERTSFIESEKVPADSQVIGQTWAKTNKDGSRDRRFKDNYQIPIAEYGGLMIRSPTGLQEAFMFSNFGATAAFASSFDEFQAALAALARRSESLAVPDRREPVAVLADRQEDDDGTDDRVLADLARPPRMLVLDAAALTVILIACVLNNFPLLMNRPAQPALATAESPTSAVPVVHAPAASAPARASEPQPKAMLFRAAPSRDDAAGTRRRETVFVQKTGTNIRAEPSTTAAVVRKETKGRELTVFGRSGQWVEVGEDRPQGWIHADLVGSKPSGP